MSVLTTIDGLPLFSSLDEALAWGQVNGFSGHHTHNYQGVIGYMAGDNHEQAVANISTQLGSGSSMNTTSNTNNNTTSTSSGYY
tara:strand:+ start:1039 stop:1290 length:252 start_codon:yes stop_codon:yes gene_type:complete